MSFVYLLVISALEDMQGNCYVQPISHIPFAVLAAVDGFEPPEISAPKADALNHLAKRLRRGEERLPLLNVVEEI